MLCALAALLAIPSASQQEAAPKIIGEIFASDASVKGAVQLGAGGMQVMSGSSIGAGQAPALLRLSRGGEVRVCPRTSLSISSSHSGRDLILGMNAGGVEADYSLAASADAIVTPDFRILLAGPGKFHIAVGADARGNTCVRPLANNTASVIISELMGDGTYQVKPDEQVVFRNGKLSSPDHVVGECGCPAPPPVQRAAVPEPPPPAAPDVSRIAGVTKPVPPSLSIPLYPPKTPPVADSTTAPLPPPSSKEVHVQVDAPFYFSANDPGPAPLAQVVKLKFNWMPPLPIFLPPPEEGVAALPMPLAPVPPVMVARAAPKSKGFFGKIGSFFSSIFR